MSEPFRFSPRPNRASEVPWRAWGSAVFDEAITKDRPILLLLTAVWSRACQEADETTFSDPRILELLSDGVIPLRVDADRHPHVQERYIAGGWPTTAFLTPTGEVLWAGVSVSADELAGLGGSVLDAWSQRRTELGEEIERRRKAVEAARGRPPAGGLVRREAADDVLTAARATFDARNGGFGEGPKFPSASAIELLYAEGVRDPDAMEMADRTLDGMLAGELLDRSDGGFFRYALAADWTEPRREKLLETQASALRAYALGARIRGRSDWRLAAAGVVGWVDRTLALDNGLWSAALIPGDDGSFVGSDPRTFVAPNARWIAALADAGGRLHEEAWVERAFSALDTLLDRFGLDGLVRHSDVDDPAMPRLLADAVACAVAALRVASVTGSASALAHAQRLAAAIDPAFWADDGGFWDRTRGPHDVGLLRYRDRLFEPNAEAARLCLDLILATGQRSFRVRAERTLAILSPLAGRYGVEAAEFALAVHEFFETPPAIVVTGGEAGASLRRAALALPRGDVRVISATNGQRIGPLVFQAEHEPAAFALGPRGRSSAVFEPEGIAAGLHSVL